ATVGVPFLLTALNTRIALKENNISKEDYVKDAIFSHYYLDSNEDLHHDQALEGGIQHIFTMVESKIWPIIYKHTQKYSHHIWKRRACPRIQHTKNYAEHPNITHVQVTTDTYLHDFYQNITSILNACKLLALVLSLVSVNLKQKKNIIAGTFINISETREPWIRDPLTGRTKNNSLFILVPASFLHIYEVAHGQDNLLPFKIAGRYTAIEVFVGSQSTTNLVLLIRKIKRVDIQNITLLFKRGCIKALKLPRYCQDLFHVHVF
ncbi:hypothetical protein ACJX0J_018721, partial [Zea mays]